MLLNQAACGKGVESDEILPLVYDELRRHAAVKMAGERMDHTLQPTALVHEAWLRLVGHGKKRQQWDSRMHFFGAAARAMRRILIDNIRRKTAIKRGGNQIRVDLDCVDPVAATPELKVLLIDEALKKLEEIDPSKAKVVLLKFYGGHTNGQVAEILNVSERTIERHWAFAKAWLFQAIQQQS